MATELQSLLSLLREKSVRLRIDGGNLRLSGPPESLTPELTLLVRKQKSQLIDHFSGTGDPGFVPVASQGLPLLSIGQEDLWHRHVRSPLEYFYNVPRAIRILGPLDFDKIARAFQSVIRRHAVLRTNVFPGPSGPVPMVRDHQGFVLAVHHFAGRSNPESEAQSLIEAEARRPFNLEKDCLVRASLLRFSDTDSILLVTAHHLLVDCWSLGFAFQLVKEPEDLWHPGLLFQSLFETYANVPVEPTEGGHEVQFSEFAAWQKAMLTSPRGRQQWEFWRSRWEPRTDQLLFNDRILVNNYEGQRVPFEVPGSLSQDIRRAAREHSTTAHALMLTAFKTLLLTWKGCQDVPVGMPVANRRNSEFQSVIGSIGNNLIVRTRLLPNRPFIEMLRSVQRDVIEAFDNQEYPIERLSEEFDSTRSLPEVRFIMQVPRSSRRIAQDLEVIPLPLNRGTSKYPLSLVIVEQPGGYHGWGEFLDDCMDRVTFDKLVDALLVYIRIGIERPSTLLGEFPSPGL